MWIDDFKNMFFPLSAVDLKIEEAMQLKYCHIPTSLFKYRSVNEHSLKNLQDDTVWLSTADGFNDPYDSSSCFLLANTMRDLLKKAIEQTKNALKPYLTENEISQLKISSETGSDFIEGMLSKDASFKSKTDAEKSVNGVFCKKHLKIMNADFSNVIKKGHKICCFSQSVKSIVMWSHYSNNHKGFALEYNFKLLPPTDIRTRLLFPVFYAKDVFNADPFIDNAHNVKSKLNPLFGIAAVIHKSPEWEYEQEWRLVVNDGPSYPPMNYSVPRPTAIYLGSKTSENNKLKLVEIASKKQVPCYQMRLINNKFELTYDKL